MELAREAGAVGCSVGRNVFQHKQPQAITHAISRVFRDKWPARQALQELTDSVAGAASTTSTASTASAAPELVAA
jgi:hypothetical protein